MTLTMYEGMFALRPALKEPDLDKVASEIKESITTNGGEVLESGVWGKRRLAYEIKGVREAHYYRVSFRMDTQSIFRLEAIFKMKDAILRNMITKKEKGG